MGDLKARLLPPRLQTSEVPRPLGPVRPLFQGMDGQQIKKRGQYVKNWVKITSSGTSENLEVDKASLMKRCELPARDLRLLDPNFVYPSTILGREKAIVVNLEQIRCIITADEVFVLDSQDHYVQQYVEELKRRLSTKHHSDVSKFKWRSPGGRPVSEQKGGHAVREHISNDGDMFSGSSADDLPFEFRALEVALEAACTFLDSQATALETEAWPVLDELTSKISTLNLELVRKLKCRLVACTNRVQKVRDEIEQLMDDDGDMHEMYLTAKKGGTGYPGYAPLSQGSVGSLASHSCPPSPKAASKALERTLSMARDSFSDSGAERVEELEMLLEAYFVVIDGTFSKLTSLKEFIDDTEDFINIQLDNVRNQLIRYELMLTTLTFVFTFFGVVAGVFGMNIPLWLFEEPRAFKWVLIIAGSCGLLMFLAFYWCFKRRHLM